MIFENVGLDPGGGTLRSHCLRSGSIVGLQAVTSTARHPSIHQTYPALVQTYPTLEHTYPSLQQTSGEVGSKPQDDLYTVSSDHGIVSGRISSVPSECHLGSDPW